MKPGIWADKYLNGHVHKGSVTFALRLLAAQHDSYIYLAAMLEANGNPQKMMEPFIFATSRELGPLQLAVRMCVFFVSLWSWRC
jgi:hypothetical protein